MRVKKPQSKRTPTKLREGIKKKAAAHRRKENKKAKTDVTWKSKAKKDPGIPNSFPYKNRVLEEIEKERQREIEERQRRREKQRQAALASGAQVDDLEDDDVMEEDGITTSNADRLGALLVSAQEAAKKFDGEDEDDDDAMEEEGDDEPSEIDVGSDFEDGSVYKKISSDTSRKAFDKVYKEVLDESDVILYVLDARNPQETRSKHIERAVLAHPSKRLMFVLNKIDLIPNETLKNWIKTLELSFPVIPLVASSSAPNAQTFTHKGLNQTTTPTALLHSLKKYASSIQVKRSIIVGVVGYPNVGKSSVINALLQRHAATRKACPVGAQAGVTTSIRKVKIDNKLSVLDSPGIVFPFSGKKSKKLSPQEEQARLILLNCIPWKQVEDPLPAVSLLLKRLSSNDELCQKLFELYDSPSLIRTPHDEFVTAFLVSVARKQGRLGKGGVPDMGGAAASVLNDWRDGRILGYTNPPENTARATAKDSSDKFKETDATTGPVAVSEWAKEFDLGSLLDGAFEE